MNKPYRRQARGDGPSGPKGLSAQHTGCAGAKPAAKPYRRQARGWRGEWYVYNHLLREFVREMHGGCPRWTPGIVHAKPYKNPSMAQKCASRINAIIMPPGSPSFPCQPVSVVTGEAARCLEAINRREGYWK